MSHVAQMNDAHTQMTVTGVIIVKYTHTHTRTHTHVCIYIYLLPESELGQKTPFSGAGSPRTTPVVTVPVAEEVNVPETGATSPAMT